MPDPNDSTHGMMIPTSEYPAGFIFYKMGRAGLLEGLRETVDVSKVWQMVVIDDHSRREKFHQQNPGKLVLTFRHVPNEFGRLLAKIGYCQVLTTLDPGEFRPVCLPYILGTKLNVSFIVGGSLEEQSPEPNFGYSLKTVAFGTRESLVLMALIRLYANTHAPAYHVVVGDVCGVANVASVIRKLGPGDLRPFTAESNMDPGEHWLPRTMPLPIGSNNPGVPPTSQTPPSPPASR